MTAELLQVHTEQVEFTYPDLDHLRKWVKMCIEKEGKIVGALNVIFCSDEYLLEINKTYLDHNYYTDIITFPFEENPIEGDLYISLDRVRENAGSHNIDISDEVDRVIIHGILHLLGYNDKTEQDRTLMTEKEDHYLAQRDN